MACILKESTDDLKKLLVYKNVRDFIDGFNNDKEKDSCISLAARLNKKEHIKVLLSFVANPLYSTTWKGSKSDSNSVLDVPKIKNYIEKEMLFNVLKEGRADDFAKLIYKEFSIDLGIESKKVVNYRDIIDLKTKDADNKNILHYLAEYSLDESSLEHCLNRIFEKDENVKYVLKSFDESLLFDYDKDGMTPFHYALIKSNEYFVRYFLSNESFKDKVIQKTGKDESIDDLIARHNISKEVKNLLREHVWKYEKDEESLISILKKDDDKKLVNFFETEKSNLSDFFNEVIKKAISFGAVKCLKFSLKEKKQLESSGPKVN